MPNETDETTNVFAPDVASALKVTLRRFPRPVLVISLFALLYAVAVPLIGVHKMMGTPHHDASAWAVLVIIAPVAWVAGALSLVALLDWRAAQIPGASQTQTWRLSRTSIVVTAGAVVILTAQLLTHLHAFGLLVLVLILLTWGIIMVFGSTLGLANWYQHHAPTSRHRTRYFRAYLPLVVAGLPVSLYCVFWTISGSTRFGF